MSMDEPLLNVEAQEEEDCCVLPPSIRTFLDRWTVPIRKCLRLAMCFATSAVVIGLMPGRDLLVQLLMQYGVASSSCKDAKSPCETQQTEIFEGFDSGASLATLIFFAFGWFFNRFGPAFVSIIGVAMTCVGLLLLQLLFMDVRFGYDPGVSWLFGVIVFLTDAGSMVSSYAVLGMVYHFEGKQTLIVSLMAAAIYVSGLFPNVIAFVMASVGLDLAGALAAHLVLVVFAGIVMLFVVPSHTEFLEEGQACVGAPLRDLETEAALQLELKRGLDVLEVNKVDHMLFAFAMGTVLVAINMYDTHLAEYANIMLDSGGTAVASMHASVQGSSALVLCAFACYVVEKYAQQVVIVLFVILLICMVVIPVFVFGASFSQQCIGTFIVAFVTSFQLPLIGRYVLTYSMPTELGIVFSIVGIVIFCFRTLVSVLAYAVLSSSSGALPIVILSLFALAAIASVIYYARFACIKIPDVPIILLEDEREIAGQYQCNNFKELLYALHLEEKDRRDLLWLLSRPWKERTREIDRRIDNLRILSLQVRPKEPMLGELYFANLFPALLSFCTKQPDDDVVAE